MSKDKKNPVNASTQTGVDLDEAAIAVRAYEKWQLRGSPHGDGQEDWFAARAELEQELGEPRRDTR